MEQLDQLLSVRKSISASLASFGLQARELTHAAPALEPVIAALQAQRKELDQQIAQLTASQPEFSIVAELKKVPGISKVTAATLASRLATHTFGHSDQFVAYCGLDVGVRQSGKKNGQTGLTKQGDGELRRLLYLAVQSNLRSKDSPFKAQYESELKVYPAQPHYVPWLASWRGWPERSINTQHLMIPTASISKIRS